jgi:hypothetical protein
MVMKNNFNLHRIGLMLKADWIEYKKSFLLFAGLLLALNLFLFRVNDRESGMEMQSFIYIAGMLGTLIYFYTFIGWKVHRSKNRFLTLPAGAMEKFVEILVVGFIFLCVCVLIHTVILGLVHLINGAPLRLWFIHDLITEGLATKVCMLSFIGTFLFMCCVAFRRYPLPLGALILIGYGIVCVYTVYLFAKIDGLTAFTNRGGFIQSNAMIDTTLFLSKYHILGLGIAIVVLLYVSYLKLKEKQIR